MSAEQPAAAGWLEFRDKWLDSEPDMRVAQLFFAPLRDPRIQTLLTLEHELAEAAFSASDSSVALAAATKIWRRMFSDELTLSTNALNFMKTRWAG